MEEIEEIIATKLSMIYFAYINGLLVLSEKKKTAFSNIVRTLFYSFLRLNLLNILQKSTPILLTYFVYILVKCSYFGERK